MGGSVLRSFRVEPFDTTLDTNKQSNNIEGTHRSSGVGGVQCPLEMCMFRQVWEASRPMIMCATPLKENGIFLPLVYTLG